MSLYLTEKVGQDLLGEGGCHRAQLQSRDREKEVSRVVHPFIQ